MTEYRYEYECDFTSMVDKIAARIQHRVDQAALDKAADTLAEFGYVKVVRCRDCAGFTETWDSWECERFSGEYHRAEPDGFCAWAVKRKEGGDGDTRSDITNTRFCS